MSESTPTTSAAERPTGSSRRRVLLALHVVLLTAICFAVYSNGYEHAFLLDSLHTVIENPSLRSLANVPEFFVDAATFTTLPANTDYRPVLQISYALNHTMGEYTMWWWHFTQIALHAACVTGLYQLCKRVVRHAGIDVEDGLLAWIAFAAAVVFALEPTGSGVVNYLSARSSLLTAAFLFPAILLYMGPPLTKGSRPAGWRLWASLALFALALFTKVEAVACLAVFFLWEVWRVSREKGSPLGFFGDVIRAVDERTLRRLASFVAVTAGYFLLRVRALAEFQFSEASKSLAATTGEYAITQTVTLWYYVGHWFAPFGLVGDYSSFTIHRSLLEPEVLLAVGAWVLLGSVAIAQWKRRPYFAFLAASALALISPTSSVVPLAEMVNEHRPYMPLAVLSLCWMIPLGLLVHRSVRAAPWSRIGFAAGALTILAGLGLATYLRNEVYFTSASYWEDVLAKAPSGRAHTNLGRVFMSNGDYRTARDHFEKSVELSPYYHIAHVNLAIVLAQLGFEAQAEEHFDRAVDYDQFSGTAYAWRGDHRARKGRFAEALADFLASRAKGQNDYLVHKGLATAYAGLDDAERCYEHYAICLDLEPVKAQREIVTIVGPFFGDASRYESGIVFCEKLAERLPEAWWVQHNLVTLAKRLGKTEQAEAELRLAEELKPK